jgi:hypothetical protein
MGRVTVEIALANYWDVLRAKEGELPPNKVRRTTVSGIVDSGAARLVVPLWIAQDLGLREDGQTNVRYADQRTAPDRIISELDQCEAGPNGSSSPNES